MIQRPIYQAAFLFLTLFFLSSCFSTRTYDLKPVLYQDDFEVFHKIVHESEDSSLVLLNVNSDDYSVNLFIYADVKKSKIVHKKERIIKKKSNKPVGIRIPVKLSVFYVEISIRDRGEGRVFRTVTTATRTNPNEWFTVLNESSPVLKPYTDLNTELQLYDYKKSKIWVTYIAKAFLPARPPFSGKGFYFNSKKDYTDRISIPSGGKVKLEGAGLYFIQSDTSRNDGFFVSVLEKGFPKINYVNQMVAPLRYITTSVELAKIASGENIKENVDAFWLNRSTDKPYAKKILREYYKRVEQANISFTTYKEGWKTDRGMVFIVFGEPDEIRISPEAEVWIYDSTLERKSVRFEFFNKEGRYILDRWEYFRRPWNVEVYEWRKGLISN